VLVRLAPVRVLFTAWYKLSLKCLPLLARGAKTRQVKTIFTRHQNWIVGISDIDLIILYNSLDPENDRILFVAFWRRYLVLRLFFPMLCWISEIRWIALECLPRHPHHLQSEVHLLSNPEQWCAVYSRPEDDPAEIPVFNPPLNAPFPLTLFLDFNLYGYLQRQLFSSGNQPGLRIERMAKCAIKITQHLHFLETGEYRTVQYLQRRLEEENASEPWQSYRQMLRGLLTEENTQQDRDKAIAYAVFNLIVELSRVHQACVESEAPAVEPLNVTPGQWSGTGLDQYLQHAEQQLGNSLSLVAFNSPYNQKATRLFLVIKPGTRFEEFYEFVRFSRKYKDTFSAEKVILNATTPVLLTSQYCGLWGHFALEPYILLSQGVYAPRGGIRLKLPEEAWTLQKIRESVAFFEEYYLPFMMSPRAKGEGMDFCKIYERTETEMLFHYFCYLKDRDGYLELMQKSGGCGDDVIAYGCARYANEIGIQDWHPYRYVDAYPYLKAMIRKVDEMALKKLECTLSTPQFSS
jgi:hypothetical protein